MIVLGVVILIILWILGDAGVALPPPLPVLFHDVGIILIVIGVILLLLHFVGVNVGRGITQRNGRGLWL